MSQFIVGKKYNTSEGNQLTCLSINGPEEYPKEYNEHPFKDSPEKSKYPIIMIFKIPATNDTPAQDELCFFTKNGKHCFCDENVSIE